MKSLATLCFLMLCAITTKAQTEKTDSLYIVTFTTGAAWDVSKTPNEQLHFREHSLRLGELRKAGTIKLGARYGDKGIIVIAATSMQSAREIISVDPAVSNKLFNADVQKLRVFYEGCLSK